MENTAVDPVGRYHQMVECGELRKDPVQARIVDQLQELHSYLRARAEKPTSILDKIFKKASTKTQQKGLYIYGDVGRGKSMLMDLFYSLVPTSKKRRVHFHAFMLEIHKDMHEWRYMNKEERLKKLDTEEDDPIPPLAAKIADQCDLLCFDEFQVTDVTDAMILGRLFGSLFNLGVLMVLTSNRIPDDLYKDGLNRGLFLPTIELIKSKMKIEALNGPVDYRLERMEGVKTYHFPLGETATRALSDAFWRLTDHAVNDRLQVGPEKLTIQGRELIIPVSSRGVAVVSFRKICGAALGAADYLAMAWKYHSIIMVGIPQMGPENRNEAKRFVTFIDALYENNVKFLCCAEVAPEDLYKEGHGHFEFQRTVSRLMEMQSQDYLAKGHAI